MNVFEIDLQDHEEIVFKVRQHWLLLFRPTWRFLLTGTGGAALAYYPLRARLDTLLIVLIILIWILLAFQFWLKDFLTWYFKMYIVTNKRIINITHEGIFRRQTTEAALHKVQDVTHRSLGLLSLMLNYGDVLVQTAGRETLIHFRMVPRSRHIHKQITHLASRQNRDL